MGGEVGSLNSGDAKWHKVDGVQVFARRDGRGQPTKVDAIDEDDEAIRITADRLQRAGYGVRRVRVARAGRIFHRLQALWVAPGDPPENPFDTSAE